MRTTFPMFHDVVVVDADADVDDDADDDDDDGDELTFAGPFRHTYVGSHSADWRRSEDAHVSRPSSSVEHDPPGQRPSAEEHSEMWHRLHPT